MKRQLSYALPIVWLIFIFLLSGESGKASSAESLEIAEGIRNFFDISVSTEEVNHFLRKAAHVFVFGTEGILIANALKKTKYYYLFSAAICSAAAFADEFHKIFVPGRHCHPEEIKLDIIASVTAITLFALGQNLPLRAKKTVTTSNCSKLRKIGLKTK